MRIGKKKCSTAHSIFQFFKQFVYCRVLDVRDSIETPDRSNFVNQPEADVILKILECMVCSPTMVDRTIGIITFYDQQRILIRHLIKERLYTLHCIFMSKLIL